MSGDDIDVPRAGWFILLDGGLAVLTTLAMSSRAYAAARAQLVLPSRRALQRLLAAGAVIHLAEAGYAAGRARRAGLSTWRWALQTLVVGFPSVRLLRRRG